MRNPTRFARALGIAAAAYAGATLVPGSASAQTKKTLATPPVPNVLLLIDNSGSMEKMIDGSDPEADTYFGTAITSAPFNHCSMSNGSVATSAVSNPNRWGTLVQTLTGSFSAGYRCYAEARNSTTTTQFQDEYSINGVKPYDYGYYLKYHRPVAQDSTGNNCVYGPYGLPDTGGWTNGVGGGTYGQLKCSGAGLCSTTATHGPIDFPSDALALYTVGAIDAEASKATSSNVGYPLGTGSCQSFDQAADGALDATRDLIRFGLMTFDTDTDPSTGVAGTSPSLTYSASTGPFKGMWSYYAGWDGASGWPFSFASNSPAGVTGDPWNCRPAQAFEVGGRNAAAPLWEGRHVRFPDGSASIVTQEANNDWLQKILVATRPYGATPIEGMFDDARNYFWNDPSGPYKSDPYSSQANTDGSVGCRDQFIILITDGVPNMDLRKACENQSGAMPGICPYARKADGTYAAGTKLVDIVRDLASGGQVSGGGSFPTVKTFVIGFAATTDAGSSVTVGSSSGAGGQFANCQALFSSITSGALPTAPTMPQICNAPTDSPPGQNDPSTAAGQQIQACCTLQAIAANGGTGVGAFFADSAGDLGKALAAILGQIASSSSSRAVPVSSPTTNLGGNTFQVSASFLSSFDPVRPPSPAEPAPPSGSNPIVNASWPWSGNISRTRTTCSSGSPQVQAVSASKADDFRQNLEVDYTKRFFWSVYNAANDAADFSATNGVVNQQQTLRPFITGNPDGLKNQHGAEVGPTYTALKTKFATSATTAQQYMNVGAGSCPPMVDLAGNPYPALAQDKCGLAALAFATGQNDSFTPFAFDHFGRYRTGSTGNYYLYSPMGAILHSSPAIAPPPSDVARDDSYRNFVSVNATRPAAMYVQTLDGLLHAFDVTSDPDPSTGTSWTIGKTAPGTTGPTMNELWSFIPPAIVPLLRSNFPGGQQNLLDGPPVVKDVVFSRTQSQFANLDRWHTVLVAGFGQSLGGYYALDVTDPVVQGGWAANTSSTLPATPTVAGTAQNKPTGANGPHFLWQLGKIPFATNTQLFGSRSGTPAITTVAINVGGVLTETGVAILPGGLPDGPFNGTCARRVSYSTSSDALPAGSNAAAWVPRDTVRKWAPGACTDAVPGRTVTIVRLGDGQILHVFGRYSSTATQSDIPSSISSLGTAFYTDTNFDSPMTGTPVVYPGQVGVAATKFFMGDADGTLWRFDISDKDPSKWKAEMFMDTFNPGVLTNGLPAPNTAGSKTGTLSKPANATDYANISQPISLVPVLSTDLAGNLVVHVATGDQDTFSPTTFPPGSTTQEIAAYNFLYSISEKYDTTVTPNKLRASVNWYVPFANGERVTGPMAVFDKAFYFASYVPISPTGTSVCANGEARLWGVDFVSAGSCSNGNASTQCIVPVPSTTAFPVSATTGYWVPGASSPSLAGQVIPGVVVSMQAPCSTSNNVSDTFAGGSYSSLTMTSAATPQLSYLTNKLNSGQTATTATANNVPLNQPQYATGVDSWAAIVE